MLPEQKIECLITEAHNNSLAIWWLNALRGLLLDTTDRR